MNVRSLLAGGALAATVLGLAGAASAAEPVKAPTRDCFFTQSWAGWKAPDNKTLYLRVNLHDVYRVGLSSEAPELTWPNARLINQVRGSNTVCTPIDLDLRVSNGDGFAVPIIATSLVKLTPDEVAAIPKKFLP